MTKTTNPSAAASATNSAIKRSATKPMKREIQQALRNQPGTTQERAPVRKQTRASAHNTQPAAKATKPAEKTKE